MQANNKRWKVSFACLLVAIAASQIIQTGADENKSNGMELSKEEKFDSPKHKSMAADAELALADPLYKFTANLFRSVRKTQENIILSPVSIHNALNLVLLAAKNGSETESELLTSLGYSNATMPIKKYHEGYAKLIKLFNELNALARAKLDSSVQKHFGIRSLDNSAPEFSIWNMLIAKNGAEPTAEYMDSMRMYYGSLFERISDNDPAGKRRLVDEVNLWARGESFESELLSLSKLDESFAMLIMSAFQVRAFWFEHFNEHQVPELFYNYGLKENLVKNSTALTQADLKCNFVDFTKRQDSEFEERNERMRKESSGLYDELAALEFRAIKVPLFGNVSYVILEPNSNQTGDELSKLEEELLRVQDGSQAGTKLARLVQFLDNRITNSFVDRLQMPKFKFNSKLDLVQALKSMNLKQIFDKHSSELPKLDSKGRILYVDQIKHDAIIEVNKIGLKASGLTTVRFVFLSGRISIAPIHLDVKNPFMFMVLFNKLPLFVGHLVHV